MDARLHREGASHLALQLFDVLQHRLQSLASVCHLRVVFGHIVLSQLLGLKRQKKRGMVGVLQNKLTYSLISADSEDFICRQVIPYLIKC